MQTKFLKQKKFGAFFCHAGEEKMVRLIFRSSDNVPAQVEKTAKEATVVNIFLFYHNRFKQKTK